METKFFEEVGISAWLEEIPAYQRSTVNELLASGLSYEQAAEAWLGRIGSGTNAPFGAAKAGPNLFQNLKIEFTKLVCGSPQYSDVVKQAKETWSKYKSGATMTIAAAIGHELGIAAVVLVPAVGLFIAATAKVSVNAWCSANAA